MTRLTGSLVAGIVLLHALHSSAATVAGVATVDGKPAAEGVVYLEAPAGPPSRRPPGHAVMDQRNLAFVPAVLPVVRGTVVEFTNSDDVQHNVFTPSAAGGKFNLGTHGPGASRKVTLDEPGEVLVLCNIHMEMEAHILVLKDPYFSGVGKDGSYRIPDVPPGAYAVHLWQQRLLPDTQTVQVPAEGMITLDLHVGK